MTRLTRTRPAVLMGFMLLAAPLSWPASGAAANLIRAGAPQNVERLRKAEARRPSDANVKRDLGVALLASGDAAGAFEKLSAARQLNPRDPLTLFHLGRAAEKLGNPDAAVEAYGAYLARSKKGADEVRARLRTLSLESMRLAARRAILEEKTRSLKSVPTNTVAVPEFTVAVSSDTLRPLSRGLALVMTTDLTKVPGLTIVERERVVVLLDELKLAKSGAVQKKTAPRIGNLLGARRFAQGGIVRTPGEQVQLDALVLDASSGDTNPTGKPVNGQLRDVLVLEKNLVFQVISAMGIKVDESLERAIGKPPTRSFEAFLAFSRGVDFEERGLSQEALAAYREAVRIDPEFTLARDHRDVLAVTPTAQTALDVALANAIGQTSGADERLAHSGTEIGLQPVPDPSSLSFTPANKASTVRVVVGGTVPR